ncbi:MAG: DnaD domain protein [Bacilli bacterium]|nr:DnaD domain protein [Bacilli bacterium]
MKSYVDLMKENIIDFGNLILEKYYLLNLNEIECMVLYKLNKYSKEVNNILNLSDLEKKMKLDINQLGDVLAGLVSKGFVTLKMSDDEKGTLIEEFSLEDAYKELSYVLENGKRKIENDQVNKDFQEVLKLLESKNNKPLSPIEMQTVQKWFFEYKYDFELIKEQIEKTYKNKNASVSIVDRQLFAKSRETLTSDEIEAAQEILKRKYGKK